MAFKIILIGLSINTIVGKEKIVRSGDGNAARIDQILTRDACHRINSDGRMNSDDDGKECEDLERFIHNHYSKNPTSNHHISTQKNS
jgi:hypothetical protein